MPVLNDPEDGIFSCEGEHENVYCLVGAKSRTSYVYINADGKDTGTAMMQVNIGAVDETFAQRGDVHLREHYECTEDDRTFDGTVSKLLGSVSGVRRSRTTAMVGGDSGKFERVIVDLADTTSSNLNKENLLNVSKRSKTGGRFQYDVMANAATRANSIMYHMGGMTTDECSIEQFRLLRHQQLGHHAPLCRAKIVRETEAVIKEASNNLAPMQHLMCKLSEMVNVRHNLPAGHAVIGTNNLGEQQERNMENFRDPDAVMSALDSLQKKMTSDRYSFVWHGSPNILSKAQFKEMATENESTTIVGVNKMSDAEYMTPLVQEDWTGSSNATIILPKSQGLNVVAHSFTVALATSKEVAHYSVMKHLMENVAGKFLKMKKYVGFFETMQDLTGRRPQMLCMYNVGVPGTESAVHSSYLELMSHITKEQFESSRMCAYAEAIKWRTTNDLTNVLPDAIASHACGAKGVLNLFNMEENLRSLTYDSFVRLYDAQMFPRLAQATSIHGMSDSLFKTSHTKLPETPSLFDSFEVGPQHEVTKWGGGEVQVPGSDAYIVCNVGVLDTFVKQYIEGVVGQEEVRDGMSLSTTPCASSVRLIVKCNPNDLVEGGKLLSRVWAKVGAVGNGAVQNTRMRLSCMSKNPSWAAHRAVDELTYGVQNERITDKLSVLQGSEFASVVKKLSEQQNQVILFMPRMIPEGSKSALRGSIVSCKKAIAGTMKFKIGSIYAPTFLKNGDLRWKVSSEVPVSNMDKVAWKLKMKCENAPMVSSMRLNHVVENVKDAVCADVIAQYLGGGWPSRGMKEMRRVKKHCYNYSSGFHCADHPSDVFQIITSSTFGAGDVTAACMDNHKFTTSFYSELPSGGDKENFETLIRKQCDILKSRHDLAQYAIHNYFKSEQLNLSMSEYEEMLGGLTVDDVISFYQKLDPGIINTVVCDPE